jgi:hypothetical protein
LHSSIVFRPGAGAAQGIFQTGWSEKGYDNASGVIRQPKLAQFIASKIRKSHLVPLSSAGFITQFGV